MRDYTTLTVIIGANHVTLDGEGYTTAQVPTPDMQGAVRKIPGDRVLAIQWHGEHGHGSIEGYGAMEGFTDKSQLAPYVKAWLVARAKAKDAAVDVLVRHRVQTDGYLASNQAAIDAVREEIAALGSGPGDAEAKVVKTKMVEAIAAECQKMRAARPTDAQVAAATAERDAARKEADDARS